MYKLRLPLRNIQVNQPFGMNYVDFYKKLGMKGHNGIDFRAFNGFRVRAAHSGIIVEAETLSDGMKQIEIFDDSKKFKTIYLHLRDYNVKPGEKVIAGQIIGVADNTGKYTTGDHLHFGLKETDAMGKTLNYDNGFKGAIDPTPYFIAAYDGTPIGNKDCYKSNAYHRYYRGRPKGGYQNELKIVSLLIKYLKRLPNNEEINACTYGGWHREAIINPAMYDIWAFLKKNEYEDGIKPFQN